MAVVGIGHNTAEALGLRWLANHQAEIGRSLERLSTGRKVNRASDDPDGFMAADGLKAEQRTVLAKIKANDLEAIRFAAIDGGLSVVGDLVQELKSSILLAANTGGSSEAERRAHQINADSIVDTLTHMANTHVFNGELILQGYIGNGPLSGLRSGGAQNLVSGDLEAAEQTVDAFLSSLSDTRAAAGARQNTLRAENNALATQNENLSAAISQIVDTDYANEVGALVRSQTLAEAATFAVQAARNLQAETVLALIRGQAILQSNVLAESNEGLDIMES